MTSARSTQEIFELFLRGDISHDEAVDALMAAIAAQRAGGSSVGAALRKPEGITLSASDHIRIDALFAAINQRASASQCDQPGT